MKFRQAHKSTTYGMVVSSFLAVAFSGLINPVLLVLAAIGIAVSWWWEAPRVHFESWDLPWTVATLLVFAYELISVLAGAELLFAGAEFLMYLLMVKLFNRQAIRDYAHVYILSFLMLTAGTVLNAEVSYGLFFLCFVLSSTWALILFHLRSEMEGQVLPRRSEVERVRLLDSEDIVGRKFFYGTSLVSIAVFCGALALFLLFPRIGFGLFFDKGRGGMSMAGFHDGVQLGGHGLIKQDTTVVMRVQVDSSYQGAGAGALHWRGVAFDNYSKGEWRRTGQAPPTNSSVSIARRSTIHHLLYTEQRVAESQLLARLKGAMKQEIYLEPVGYDVVFGASLPLAYEFETKLKSKTHPGTNDEMRHAHAAGIKYTVYSDPVPPAAELLRSAGNEVPESFELYLQLPDEIPACPETAAPVAADGIDPRCRVQSLAQKVTEGATSNYDKVMALQHWLQSEFGYTLQMEDPGDMEPLEYFLFERRQGHCEYFSSAMSIMARSVGVPTRNVNGFLGGEWNEYDDYIAVRAGDAHSWVEVYFEGFGWVTFDPTPGGEADLMGRSLSFIDRMRRIGDTIRFKWFKWVIEYDLYQQLKLFQNLGSSLKGGAKRLFEDPLRNAKTWAKDYKRTVIAVIVVAIVGVLLLGLRRRRRQGTGGIGHTVQRKRSIVAKQYRAVLKLLARRGFRRGDSMTPREFSLGLKQSDFAGADALRELTDIYYHEEYSSSSEPGRNTRAKELKVVIARSLRRRGRRIMGTPRK